MDGPDPKRNKKSDKAKRNFEKTGGFSSKHVRFHEALLNKTKTVDKPKK